MARVRSVHEDQGSARRKSKGSRGLCEGLGMAMIHASKMRILGLKTNIPEIFFKRYQ
jgi:hypothetical protein